MTEINTSKLLKKAKIQILIDRCILLLLMSIVVLLTPKNTINTTRYIAGMVALSYIILSSILKYKGYLIDVNTPIDGCFLVIIWLLGFLLWFSWAMKLINSSIFMILIVILGALFTTYEIKNLKYEDIKNKKS